MSKKSNPCKTIKIKTISHDEPRQNKYNREIPVPVPKPAKTPEQELQESRSKLFNLVISNKPVQCKCNHCGHHLNGQLVSSIFSIGSNLTTPFISYTCAFCKRSGFRSVQERALSPDKFEECYFS